MSRETGVVRYPANGAPGTVRPTRRGVTLSNNPTSSVIQRKGRRGRRPLRWLRVGTFLWSREVGGQFGYSFRARYVIFRNVRFATGP